MKLFGASVCVGVLLVGGAAEAGTHKEAVAACADRPALVSESYLAFCEGLRLLADGEAERAHAKFLIAAAAGHSGAQFDVAVDLETGHGVAKDIDEALIWYRKAAEQGLADAQNNYAYVYFYGKHQRPIERAKAIPWLQKAAAQGYAHSQTLLAEAFYNGEGVAQDFDAALRLYREAEKSGHPFATYMLGVMHLKGQGVATDPAAAARYLERAANANIEGAQILLGAMYMEGRGVPADDTMALTWFEVAALNEQDTERQGAVLRARMSADAVAAARKRAAEIFANLRPKVSGV